MPALRGLAVCLCVLWAQMIGAQQAELPQSTVLTVEFERLFFDSVYGARFEEEVEAQRTALEAENRRIETELAEEERLLTEQRSTMTPEAFRPLAEAFDEKVQASRRESDAKVRELGSRLETAQREVLRAAQPVLDEIMRDTGAVAIFDRRSVLLSVDSIDITDQAIARLNAQAGAAEVEDR